MSKNVKNKKQIKKNLAKKLIAGVEAEKKLQNPHLSEGAKKHMVKKIKVATMAAKKLKKIQKKKEAMKKTA